MNILLIHGYLLTGTGSNLYVENLARQFCKKGHSVFLVCQEYFPEKIDYIESIFEFEYSGKDPILSGQKATEYPGKCKFYRPHIGELLPVYVLDHYRNFRVKIFPECTNQEIQQYIKGNMKAISWIMNHHSIDIIQTNHLIMFPFIISRTLSSSKKKIKNYITVHGSALNFSIKRDRRFIYHAREGLLAADAVFVDSEHARSELLLFARKNNMNFIQNRIRIIPAGVDVDRFDLMVSAKHAVIDSFIHNLQSSDDQNKGRSEKQTNRMLTENLYNTEEKIGKLIAEVRSSYDYLYPDQELAVKMKKLQNVEGEVVIFVGKYLWTKGIYLILLAIPLVLKKYPRSKFVFVGFGPFREIAELIINCLSKKRINLLQNLMSTRYFSAHENGDQDLPFLHESLEKHRQRLCQSLNTVHKKIIDSIIFTGILNHDKLRYILPISDVLVAPSVFPEAFGMVAIEALACGVYPIITYQSAFKEIVDEIKTTLADDSLHIETISPSEDAFIKIYNNIDQFFKFKQKLIKNKRLIPFKQKLRDLTLKNYSWQAISSKYIEYYKNTVNH